MGYKIEYGKQERRKLPQLTILAFCLFLLLVCAFWPQGRAVLVETFFPGDRQVTARAVALLVGKLRDGAGAMEALEAFCGCVLAGS